VVANNDNFQKAAYAGGLSWKTIFNDCSIACPVPFLEQYSDLNYSNSTTAANIKLAKNSGGNLLSCSC